eukprot:gene9204-1490_t
MAERSTSKKHDEFVRERMENKFVDQLAGIGPKGKEQLEAAGFDHAKQILGQFLVLAEDEFMFKDWLKETAPCLQTKHHNDLIHCLREWIKRNL